MSKEKLKSSSTTSEILAGFSLVRAYGLILMTEILKLYTKQFSIPCAFLNNPLDRVSRGHEIETEIERSHTYILQ